MHSISKVVIIHGSYGSPEENWFPWLAGEVRSRGHEALVPRFPTPEGQSLVSWRRAFSIQIGEITSNMVLIGHSLSPAFILNLLEESSVAVRGTFLVSGFLGNLGLSEFDTVNETFVCREFDWKTIRLNAGNVSVYNSDNDPYVPLSKGKELADKLGVELIIIENGGHINASAGFTTFPQLLDDLISLIEGYSSL